MKKRTCCRLGMGLFLGLAVIVSFSFLSSGSAMNGEKDVTGIPRILPSQKNGSTIEKEDPQEELARLLSELALMKQTGMEQDRTKAERVRALRHQLSGSLQAQQERTRPGAIKLPHDTYVLQKIAQPQDPCIIQYHDGVPAYYLYYWNTCEKLLIWIDPERFCPPPYYPWHLEEISLYLYRPDESYADYAFIKLDAEDCFEPDPPYDYADPPDPCLGPVPDDILDFQMEPEFWFTECYEVNVPSIGIVTQVIIPLDSVCVYRPFFLSIHICGPDNPPALLTDASQDAPPCFYWDNWNGFWFSWDNWDAGDPMIDIFGTVGTQANCDPYHTYERCPYPSEVEPNDIYDTANPIDCVILNEFGPICGDIQPSGDHDWYIFNLNERSRVRIDVYADDTPYFYPYMKGLDSYVTLYDAGLNILAQNDDNHGPPGPWGWDSNLGGLWNYIPAWAVPQLVLDPGTYFIDIRGYSDSTGPYIVALCCYPCRDKANLFIDHPWDVVQNVPFEVTVSPLDDFWDLACGGPWWIDFSSGDPCVKLPQGDLLLCAPRTFEVIAPCPTESLVIEVEEVKEWDPDNVIYTYSGFISVWPAEIDQPDVLNLYDLPNDQGGYVVAEWDYSDNHPGLAQYNVVDFYKIYREMYPIVYYDDAGHPAGQDFAYPHLTRGTSYNGWGSSPEKSIVMDNTYIAFRYTGLDPSGATKDYRARVTLYQAADPAVETRIVRIRAGVTNLTAHGMGDPDITVTNVATTYVFDIPDAEITAQGRLYLYVDKVAGNNAVVSEVWIEEDDSQWYEYGMVWTSPVPDPIGGERIIMPDYGFAGTTSEYFVEAVDEDLFKVVGEPGEFVLQMSKVVGEVDVSGMCGPVFGRSLDNIAPSDPGQIRIVGHEVSWALSPDDRLLEGGSDWLGNRWEMFGVSGYIIFRDGAYAGMVDRGVTSWADPDATEGAYRVYAYDGTNLSKGNTPVQVIPTTYSLSDNYPNPFNPETHISFALPREGEVRLSIYNVLGEKVADLVNGQMEAGYHRVRWDGKDVRGVSVSSGIYFYRLASGDFTATKKMTLVK